MIHSAMSEALFVRLVNQDPSIGPLYLWCHRLLQQELETFRPSMILRSIPPCMTFRDCYRFAMPSIRFGPERLKLGMSGGDIERFMGELTDMQDADSEDSRFSDDEPRFSSSGFSFPNAPIQTGNSLNAWFALEPGMRRRIAEISHHYTKTGVNLRASPEVIRDAALGGYGARLFDDSAAPSPLRGKVR